MQRRLDRSLACVRARTLLLAASFLFCAGCVEIPPDELDTRQAVYDSLFSHLGIGRGSRFYVVAETETEWFHLNPFNAGKWRANLRPLEGISIDLVKHAYDVNRQSESLDWTPGSFNAELLPEKHLATDSKPHIEVQNVSTGLWVRCYYTVSNRCL